MLYGEMCISPLLYHSRLQCAVQRSAVYVLYPIRGSLVSLLSFPRDIVSDARNFYAQLNLSKLGLTWLARRLEAGKII